MRLNRYVASGSRLSRRAADIAISNGEVTVNGIVAELGMAVSETDEVRLKNILLELPTSFRYVMMNKPVGCVVSKARQNGSVTVYDILPKNLAGLNPVGRLDKDSGGLLLLSDDGEFVHRASHPSSNKEKVYELVLDKHVAALDLARLESGVLLEDGLSRMRIIASNGPRITVGIKEGRNRQLRRTAAAIGYTVVDLYRIKFGALEMGDLEPGTFKLMGEEPAL